MFIALMMPDLWQKKKRGGEERKRKILRTWSLKCVGTSLVPLDASPQNSRDVASETVETALESAEVELEEMWGPT